MPVIGRSCHSQIFAIVVIVAAAAADMDEWMDGDRLVKLGW